MSQVFVINNSTNVIKKSPNFEPMNWKYFSLSLHRALRRVTW